jgi:hypothetical protein
MKMKAKAKTKTAPSTKKRPTTKPAMKKRATATKRRSRETSAGIAELQVGEIEALRQDIERRKTDLERGLSRWNANPEDVQKSVAQLVLALVEFLRKLLERQAIRRMESETLSSDETERIGIALMRLEETVHDLARRFGLSPEELNLDLGPLGRLI